MKFLIILFLLTSFTQASEGVGDSSGGSKVSWKEILTNYNRYDPESHKIKFENRFIETFETCYLKDSDQLRTKKEVKVYNRVSQGDRDLWLENGKKYLFTDRVYTEEVCEGHGRRCDWRQVVVEQSLKPIIAVRAPARGDRTFGRLLFKKEYKISDCK